MCDLIKIAAGYAICMVQVVCDKIVGQVGDANIRSRGGIGKVSNTVLYCSKLRETTDLA